MVGIILFNKCLNVFLDEPSKPNTPEIIDYDNQSVTLKWTAPEKDGGAPIEKYFIEKKDRYLSTIINIVVIYYVCFII